MFKGLLSFSHPIKIIQSVFSEAYCHPTSTLMKYFGKKTNKQTGYSPNTLSVIRLRCEIKLRGTFTATAKLSVNSAAFSQALHYIRRAFGPDPFPSHLVECRYFLCILFALSWCGRFTFRITGKYAKQPSTPHPVQMLCLITNAWRRRCLLVMAAAGKSFAAVKQRLTWTHGPIFKIRQWLSFILAEHLMYI